MIDIESIKIGARIRADLGDLAQLQNSIEQIGLLHPVVLASDLTLVAGQRRLIACCELGWKQIPAIIKEKTS